MISGRVLQPVGGGEPASRYGLSSDHLLPPAVAALDDLRKTPCRTPRCDVNHGIESNTVEEGLGDSIQPQHISCSERERVIRVVEGQEKALWAASRGIATGILAAARL